MNKIVFAGKNPDGKRLNKHLEIFVTNEKAVIVPPYCEYKSDGADGVYIIIEQPVLPLKEVTVFPQAEAIKHTALQAEEFSGCENGGAVLQSLGNLLVSLICFYAEKMKRSPAVELVREDIIKNVSNSAYALDDYIKKLPLNYDYVRKLFQKEVGVTPREYLEGLRMELAASLLSSGISNKYSNYSVSQVAEACGFAEPLYFSRVFKKHFGVSPSQFKRSV